MFKAQKWDTINSTWKVVSFEIIMTTSVIRSRFSTRHQTCKIKTKTDFFGLRPVLSQDRRSQTTSLLINDNTIKITILRERQTEPGLVAFYDIRPGNGAGHSYNPGARTGLWNSILSVFPHTVHSVHYGSLWLICKPTRIWHVPAKHANRMDARAHTSTLAECAPRFMTPRSQGFVGHQSSPNLAHV